MSMEHDPTDEIVLDPSGIGEAVKHGLSPWFIKINFQNDEPLSDRAWKEATSPLSALPARTGNRFEQEVYNEIRPHADEVVESWRDYEYQEENNTRIQELVAAADSRNSDAAPSMLLQTQLAGDVDGFYIAGDADLILIWPGDPLQIRIFDIKSSWEEQTYHQVQVAVYSILLDRILSDSDIGDYELDGGIIYRETALDAVTPSGLPNFNVSPREDDIHRLLDDDGPFHRAFDTPFSKLPLPVDGGQSSPYAEVYNTKAVETNDISLLGLTAGEQRILLRHELTTLEDIAELVEPPENPRPYQFEDPEIRKEHRDLVRTLEERRGLGTRIPVLAQRAQALLGELNPDHPDAHDKPWTPWIQGAGVAKLPEDNPEWGGDDLPYEPGSLIRIYVNVQYDYIRDQVTMLGARLDCTNYDGEPLSFTHAVTDIPDDYNDRTPEETLLTTFADDLFDAIEALTMLSGQGPTAPIHFYLYTEQEREAFVESTARHADRHASIHSLRDLFGFREGIDQAMVSTVQPEIEQRLALKQPSTGLFQMTTSLYPNDDDHATLSFEDFEYEREDGTEIDLREAFNYELFDDARPYVRDGGSVRFLTGQSDAEPDGFYPLLPRQDAQIPLEYLWATEDVDQFGPDWTDQPQHKALIEKYQWVDTNTKHTRLTCEDIEALGDRATHALHHLERSLSYRDEDIHKSPLNINVLDSYTLGDATLDRAVREYLDLEHQSAVADTLAQYRTPVKQRILSGRSVPVRITDVEDEGYMLRAEADLIYDAFTFEEPDKIAKSSRAGGADGGSSGSWKVSTPLELTPTGYTDSVSNPDQLKHSRPVTIDEFDPDDGRAVLTSYRQSDDYKMRYATWSKNWSLSETDGSEQYFGPGQEFILDDPTDDRNANKALVALDYADRNPLYTLMTDFLEGTRTAAPLTSDRFDDIDDYMDWVTENCEFAPNAKQDKFITQTSHKIGLLQGPPGTGKTSGALAHALLGRAYSSAANDEPFRAAVTGASNKSVDEVLGDVAELLASHDDDGPLGDTMLVRLVLDDPDDPDHENVAYVNYNNTDHPLLPVIAQRLEGTAGGHQSGLDDYTDGDALPKNIIVFGTPGRLQKLTAKLNRGVDVEGRYESGERFFDVVAADESSMLPLWQLFMVSAFWESDGGQVLLAGDQRQMPPVQSHEWDDETRRIIEECVPYLSSLNYFRFLRGENVHRIADHDIESPEVTVPITRLERTYRCHEDVSEFLSEWVYAQDGIEYTSKETATITSPGDNLPDGVGIALDPDEPISLLLHDDTESHQSNYSEASLVRVLIDYLPDEEDVGVVVPHNAQKGLISAMCGDDTNVDTVERFQGGQKDVIILSATVSDPDFLQQESEFILNPNRLNVALSRMKKKLIVVAPRTLFSLLPQDVEEYDNSIIWKGLYSHVDASGEPHWSGEVQQFADLDPNLPLPDTTFEVYGQRDI